MKQRSQKLHTGSIIDDATKWSWIPHTNRRVDTIITQMRIGHIGLKEYLNRFGMAGSPMCSRCNTPESISHYLLTCTEYQEARRKTVNALRAKGIPHLSLKIILGGGDFDKDLQNYIKKVLARSIVQSGRANSL